MLGWVLVAVWAAGWVLAVRPSMRRTMLQEVCSECRGRALCDCRPGDLGGGYLRPPRVVRGSEFERDGGDVAQSVWVAAWWPVWLWIVCTRITLRGLGAGVTAAVIRATPLTGPELERRLAEQQAEIARLTEQIGDTS